ncbi:MAG: YceI family protein [Desulfuromonas sp.]|nr:YceI family protein [Desulfuromonas sp.]
MLPLLLQTLVLIILVVPATALELPGTCDVAFTGSSTLHDFDGTAACAPFVLAVTEASGGEPDLAAVTLSVPVAGMRTGIERRDRTMRDMFEAGPFPQITGRLAAAPLAELRRQLHQAARSGSEFTLWLRIRGLEQPVATKVTRLLDTPQGFGLDLEFSVSLAAFRLEPPTVLGFIRVADLVRVKVGVQTAPLPAPWPP